MFKTLTQTRRTARDCRSSGIAGKAGMDGALPFMGASVGACARLCACSVADEEREDDTTGRECRNGGGV